MNHLTEELRVVRDVLDEAREDLSWLTQNGIPGQASELRPLVRRTKGTLVPEENERAVIAHTADSPKELPTEVFDELVAEITEIVTFVGQEQANLLLTAIDELRAKLVATIKSATPSAANEPAAATLSSTSVTPSQSKSSESRSLF